MVKNEGELLLRSISYHRTIGFDHFIVFLDGTTDDTATRLAGMPDVQVLNSVEPGDQAIAHGPEWIAAIAPRWSSDMDVRKRINTFAAIRLAQAQHVDWMLCVDPDEVFHATLDEPPSAERTREFFRNIPPDADQVLLRNLEAVPPAHSTGNPLVDCTRFLARFPATEALRRVLSGGVRRIARFPAAQAWFDYLFYQVRFMGALPRLLVHPATGKRVPASYFLGYSNHKSAIRPERAAAYEFVVHYWRKWHSAPRNIHRGNVLHYDLFSLEYFLEKFRQRQQSMVMKVFYVRYWLARIARECSVTEVQDFYLKYIALADERVLDRLSRRGIVLQVTSVARLAHEMPQSPETHPAPARCSGVGTSTEHAD